MSQPHILPQIYTVLVHGLKRVIILGIGELFLLSHPVRIMEYISVQEALLSATVPRENNSTFGQMVIPVLISIAPLPTVLGIT